ncbi:hypothetical protein PanWU01x14_272190 [Parasponia andersonii]|uniref:Uncharacterized protein n=1 Tax=Parasponia andersonii TaxID=3476 RepID=A0A2P5B4I2_PARAD|nr:hypothetical protein PanWU01x14_272190 [Parasponia andersonii]
MCSYSNGKSAKLGEDSELNRQDLGSFMGHRQVWQERMAFRGLRKLAALPATGETIKIGVGEGHGERNCVAFGVNDDGLVRISGPR